MTMQAADLETKAGEVADILRAIANERRLLVLCQLAELGEAHVNGLAESVGLSQSALSQHLARLRRDKLVQTRRNAQTIFYSLSGRHVERVLQTLHDVFCPN